MNIRRQSIILKLLREKKSVTIQEIIDSLEVSEATVRRDLTTLEKSGKLTRVHGGAILTENREEDIISKKNYHQKAKEKIAKKASDFVKNGDVIYLDAGTTTGAIIKYLETKENIIVITNGITHLEELNRYGIKTFLLGGQVKYITGAMVGAGAIFSLRTYNIDVAFIGANAFDTSGYSTPDTNEAMIKSEAVRRSEKVYFLCDLSKHKKKSLINFATLNDGELITEGEIPFEIKNFLSKKGGKR